MVDARLDMGRGRSRYWRKHPLNFLKWQSLWFVQAMGLYLRLMTSVPESRLRREYHRRFWNLVKKRFDPGIWLYYLLKVAFHYHAQSLANQIASGQNRMVNSY
jgi:hypothetical protein